jgi:short-subunit dehydrogenase
MARPFQSKKVKNQVIVITGASSGIGLATARLAAKKGAKVVLSSRNEEDLRRVCNEIRKKGGEAIYVVADVSDPAAVKRIADEAVREFGGFDTWVNNAAVAAYGKLEDLHLNQKRHLFDVNFWGVVHGCRAALPVLRERGGSIINIGSVVSNRALPVQGIYSASKHAVKAYTDALRMELEADGVPVSVTLIKPAAINTPYSIHALNLQPEHAQHVPPVYAAEVVARAILRSAERPIRDVFVGGSAKVFSWMETFMPRVTDKIMERTMVTGQQSNQPNPDPGFVGFDRPPVREGDVAGDYPGMVRKRSYYTFAAQRPGVALSLLGMAVASVVAFRNRDWLRSRVENWSRDEATRIEDQLRRASAA